MPDVADILLKSPDGQLLLVAEVKARASDSLPWAVRFRRNLVAHGLIRDGDPFLLATPRTGYFWKARPSGEEVEERVPDAAFGLGAFLNAYLPAGGAAQAGGEALELAVASWLADLASGAIPPASLGGELRELVESSAGGAVHLEVRGAA